MQMRSWADPAAIAELLASAGQSNALPTDELAAQQTIRDEEKRSFDGLSDWDYSPCVVARAYNHLAGSTAVGDASFSDSRTAGIQIANAISARHQPLIALIDGGLMYVVVVGVTLGPNGANGPPMSVVVDDPWQVSKYGPTRNDGAWPALGTRRVMAWEEFLSHFTTVPANLQGTWSGTRVLVGFGLPLSC
jgi:hypothetical protein